MSSWAIFGMWLIAVILLCRKIPCVWPVEFLWIAFFSPTCEAKMSRKQEGSFAFRDISKIAARGGRISWFNWRLNRTLWSWTSRELAFKKKFKQTEFSEYLFIIWGKLVITLMTHVALWHLGPKLRTETSSCKSNSLESSDSDQVLKAPCEPQQVVLTASSRTGLRRLCQVCVDNGV